LGWALTIDEAIDDCTPKPPVELERLKLEEVLDVRASTTELITNLYWVAPVVSDKVPPITIVRLWVETEQLLTTVILE
jgi:hypothetical protein